MRLSCIIGAIKMLDSFRNNMRGIATVIVVLLAEYSLLQELDHYLFRVSAQIPRL